MIKAEPFVKYVGGKRQLLPALSEHFPTRFNTYYEPFVGGGAVFFHLSPSEAVLSDANERLVRAYRGGRDSVDGVINRLREMEYGHRANPRGFFHSVRKICNDALPSNVEAAAWFIYLNKTCFNGLYRVNKRGEFNVPFGDQPKPTICDERRLRACSAALRSATIVAQDFAVMCVTARPGDLVYFDPPYATVSKTASFTSYTKDAARTPGEVTAFQERVRDVARALKRSGVHVVVSNADVPLVRRLYEGFEITEVRARRSVNSKGSARGPVGELIIR